jgi:hypothetical protein
MFKLQKIDLIIIVTDLILGTFFSVITYKLFSVRENSFNLSVTISYSLVVLSATLYMYSLIKNRNGYIKGDYKPADFGKSFSFLVSLNAILITAFLAAALPNSDNLLPDGLVPFIICQMNFICSWIWNHLLVAIKLSRYYTKKTDFSKRDFSYYFLFPFLSLSGVFNSVLYKELIDNSNDYRLGTIILTAVFIAFMGWLFCYPARRMFFAIKGEHYQKNRLFPYLLLSSLIKIISDLYFF